MTTLWNILTFGFPVPYWLFLIMCWFTGVGIRLYIDKYSGPTWQEQLFQKKENMRL